MVKHSRFRRFIWRLMYRLLHMVISIVGYCSHRWYMRLYAPLLKAFGLKLNGSPRYIAASCYFDDINKITLGNRVVISSKVSFLTHDYSLTTALASIGELTATDVALEREIIVGNNVFIGLGTIVMPGAVIGDNVIIGAGSVVRGRVESNSVVIGNPAVSIRKVSDYAERWKDKVETELVRFD